MLNDPVNFVDPLGLRWFRSEGAPYYVGSTAPGSPILPGKDHIGGKIDDFFPAAHDFGYLHDGWVRDFETAGIKPSTFSWWVANCDLPNYGRRFCRISHHEI